VFSDVATKLLKSPEARLVTMAMRRYSDFKRAWPAGLPQSPKAMHMLATGHIIAEV